MNNVKIFVSVLIILVLGIVATVLLRSSSGENQLATGGQYESFAQCLVGKGVAFYGAFWCPHCAAQEKDFGMSRDELTKVGLYNECSLPDASGQNQLCTNKGIKSYPTWIFPDGSELTGETPLATLADKSGCQLPGADSSAPAPSDAGASSSAQTAPAPAQ
ncbi:MAG TPA: hypothetical protein VG694_02305 [Candidatus Paceibacterota bacterium]|jgi:hypothetical protein|nr:hypothetical protein [Candidatus Paceibacterota bacterium]